MCELSLYPLSVFNKNSTLKPHNAFSLTTLVVNMWCAAASPLHAQVYESARHGDLEGAGECAHARDGVLEITRVVEQVHTTYLYLNRLCLLGTVVSQN